ncbi:MAG: magnesium/cobalt efflux protein [Gammaproteobacteria bacterium]|nr:magnesium/cobalt efflux protein [Gammaproteobacteria bacterium]
MDDISLSLLFGILFLLILLSAFFSVSETGMMALNRYRLRHLVKDKHRGAILANALLERPDRLIGLILLGNNLANFLAVSIATLIAVRLIGEAGYAIAPILLTPIVLIFAEMAPKTYAAIRPEKVALTASYVLNPLMKICYPFVYAISTFSNGIIALFGINPEDRENAPLSREELRTIVREAGAMIPTKHQRMLLSILDLENETVDDIMVPRSELIGIDLNDPPNEILEQLTNCQHTRLIVYRDNIDNLIGMLHVRRVLRVLTDKNEFTPADLEKITSEPYYVPEGTPLHTQLVNFQRQKRRTGLVVDEYGVIQGMVTLEDILEEIVGEFTTDMQTFNQDIHSQQDGSVIIDGTATIRDINKQLHWKLPADGPKTLNGLILEHLENIPEAGTSLRIGHYAVEITQAAENAVKTAKITLIKDDTGQHDSARSA